MGKQDAAHVSFEHLAREDWRQAFFATKPLRGRTDKEPGPQPAGPAASPQSSTVARWDPAAPGPSWEPAPSEPTASGPAVRVPPDLPEPPPPSALSIEVNPPDVGPVRVRVVLHDRTVHANVSSEHADLRLFLLDHQDRLGHDLQKYGLTLGEFHVTPEDRQERRDEFRLFIESEAGRSSRRVAPDSQPEETVAYAGGNRAYAVSLFA